MKNRLQATGYRLQATGYRLQVTGYRLQATGYRLQATGYRLQATGYRLQATGYRLQVTGYRLQVTGYRLQVTGYRLQATGYRVQATGYSLKRVMFRVLLINPWATDFSAFDLWARPLGLLYLAGVVRHLGGEPILVDCLDRNHWSLSERPFKPRAFSCGKYPAQEIAKPAALRWVPRKFKRYGISANAFRQSLDRVGEPNLILVGSRMTHWYPGVVEAIAMLRERFPHVPIALGGVYATLFPEHARRFSGADHIVAGEGENAVVRLVNELAKPGAAAPPFDLAALDDLPEPAYDLLSARDCLPFLTSRGCPQRCSYCASHRMFGRFRRRDPIRAADHLVECIERFASRGTGRQPVSPDSLENRPSSRPNGDVAFYDDALLAGASRHFVPFCDRLLEQRHCFGSNVRFHTPNGVDFGSLDDAVAERMVSLGFENLRLSLETANRERLKQMGRKSDLSRFEAALRSLSRAGFDLRRVGVYILFGLPGQKRAEIEQTVDYVLALGAMPKLGEFSPLPFTVEWDKVRALGNPPLEEEPLLANNSVFYRLDPEFPDSWVNDLRRRIRDARLPNAMNDDEQA